MYYYSTLASHRVVAAKKAEMNTETEEDVNGLLRTEMKVYD